MLYLIATAHIVGALLAMGLISVAALFVAGWEAKRNEKKLLADLSLEIGVPVTDLERDDVIPRFTQVSSQRYSSELFRNRLSDLCGVVRIVWGWVGSLIQVGIVVGVSWFAFTDKLENAVYVWWVFGVQVFFWIVSVVFSLVCRLLTGRYPGEAKSARRSLADYLDSKHRAGVDGV